MRKRRLLIALVALAIVAGLAAPAFAQVTGADSLPTGVSTNKALDYIKSHQQADGGFAEPGGKSSEQLTSWVVCALVAAGQDAGAVRKSGRSPLDYLAALAGNTTKLTDLEKDCLAVCAAGMDPRSFGGKDLVAAVKSHMAGDGHIGDLINEHCWGMLALAAAGEPVPASCRTWLAARQNIDGGFGYATDSGSDPDDTGAAIQAFIAAGESKDGSAVTRALSYLQFCQSSDGGFTWQSQGSNVGSTSWCVQGIVAAGEDLSSSKWTASGNTPLDFLSKMQQGDGHFKQSVASDPNPVWMTAEGLPAVLKKPFPIKPTETTKVDPAPTRTDPANTTTTDNSGTKPRGSSTGQTAAGTSSAGATTSAGGNSAKAKSRSVNSGTGGGVTARVLGIKTATGGSGDSNSLAVFVLFCAMYLVVLGLAYLCLKVFMP
jgi:iron complex transport system substrate-binding protein